MTSISKLASAVFNDIHSGLSGITATISISLQLLEDEVVETRAEIIRELFLKNILPRKLMLYSLNCISTDCLSLDKCCATSDFSTPELHFEIPLVFLDFDSISFIGSTDKLIKFKVYTNPSTFKYHKYRSRRTNIPYVYIDPTINKNGRLDGYIFNAPFLERLTVLAIFFDPRQVEEYLEENSCCEYIPDLENENSTISSEIKKRLTERKFKYYRQGYQAVTPNDQNPK